jgi:hypothetical protein
MQWLIVGAIVFLPLLVSPIAFLPPVFQIYDFTPRDFKMKKPIAPGFNTVTLSQIFRF